ncbi:hypothetical protein E2320_018285 [Naja naja]|nr:hypothetical protein E2320_018285 [Naja naja]
MFNHKIINTVAYWISGKTMYPKTSIPPRDCQSALLQTGLSGPAAIYVRSVNNTQVWKKMFVATAFADHSTAFNLKAEKPFLKVPAAICKYLKAPHAEKLLSALLVKTS